MSKKNTIKRLLGIMTARYRSRLLLVVIFILIGTFASVAGSFFIKQLIDVSIPKIINENLGIFDGLFGILLLLGGVYLAGIVTTFLYNIMMVSISQGVQKTIREDLFSHMQTLPIRYFDTHTHGDIMSRFTNDIDTLREFFGMSLPQLISSIATILTVTVSMLRLNPLLTLIVFCFVFLTLYVSKTLGMSAAKTFRAQQAAVGDLSGYIKEIMAGQRVVKVFCHEEKVLEQFDTKNSTLREHSKKANRLVNIIMPIVMNIATLQYVAIALIGGILAINNVAGITLGSIAAFLILSRTFSAPIGQVSTQINSMTMAIAGASRIFEVMDEASESDDGTVTLVNVERDGEKLTETDKRTGSWAWKSTDSNGVSQLTVVKGDVRLIGVTFGYVENKTILHDVSLYAKPGQKIAFVGATGAGKTTITNLINRFYDINSGEILYDGINIKNIKKSDLRRSLGIVLQDTHLFSGTIMENIRYGNLLATDEEVIKAAKTANADDFISRLPQGYNTELSGDGANLSGGQRQLIAIARASVANPPVMILDEATSSIDTRTEAIIGRGMDSLMDGKTVFVIAHRLSTVQNSKAIMVLEQGEIVERGSHAELLAQKGRYFAMHNS